MSFHLDFEEADAFATGAIGMPGARTFYVQVRAEGHVITVKCEKQQVAQMADHLRGMLSDLPEPQIRPDTTAAMLSGSVEPDFVLGTIGLGIDRASQRMVVQLEEVATVDIDPDEFDELDVDDPEEVMEFIRRHEEDADTSMVRVLLTAEQARSFCSVAETIVESGRSVCRWCDDPMDPAGHACPKFN